MLLLHSNSQIWRNIPFPRIDVVGSLYEYLFIIG